MKKISWGIIGCGDVTEVKSGPAFNKVPHSELVAVMRRDAVKAQDYARRHHVPKWYSDADALINDAEINAIYVATPPSSHEAYTLAAFKAGKPVYVEKPMTIDATSAARMAVNARENNLKLVVAHYRRAQPLFKKIKQLLDEKAIGETRFARLELYKKTTTPEELLNPQKAWRVNTAESGGGLFHDLAPHQLDLMYYFFGAPKNVSGFAVNQAGVYNADDMVAGTIEFRNGVLFSGIWGFNVDVTDEKDYCEIMGEKGKISFSFFEHKPITLTTSEKIEMISFDPLPHVQQPMIERVVEYFRDKGPNPCSGEDGIEVMKLLDAFTKK
jgi:predicted dehydrogenase